MATCMVGTGENVTRIRSFILWLAVTCLLTSGTSVGFCADSQANREYRLKAAFLYNFIMFIDNKRFQELDRDDDPNQPIRIGVLGQDPFGDAFDPLRGKDIRHRRVVVTHFKGLEPYANDEGRLPERHPQLDRLRECHVLFVGSSEKPYLARILRPIRKEHILTVADTPGFLEAGGVINFVIVDKKVRFEINTAAARRARLRIRSKLLRLAKRVVTHDAVEGPNDEGNEQD